MKKIVCWLVAAFALLSCTEGEGNVALGIIPMPNEMETASGHYTLSGETTVSLPAGENAQKVVRYLADVLGHTSVSLKPVPEGTEADLCLAVARRSLPACSGQTGHQHRVQRFGSRMVLWRAVAAATASSGDL